MPSNCYLGEGGCIYTHDHECDSTTGCKARETAQAKPDNVNHPKHYTSHPSGIECIQVTRHMNFNIGNAIKYLWRADLKGSSIEDLKKARWYIDDEIKLREQGDGKA